jgi:hypothetical protein
VTATESDVLLEREIRTQEKLNQVGRRRLLAEPLNSPSSRSLWVNALIDVKGDLHCIFYLLSENPSLFNDAGMWQVGGQV